MDYEHWNETVRLLYLATIHGDIGRLSRLDREAAKIYIESDWGRFLPVRWSNEDNFFKFDKEKSIEFVSKIGATFQLETEEEFREKLYIYWKSNSHRTDHQNLSSLHVQALNWLRSSRTESYKKTINEKYDQITRQDIVLLIYSAVIHGDTSRLSQFNRKTTSDINHNLARLLPIKWSSENNCYKFDKKRSIEFANKIGATFQTETKESFSYKLKTYLKENSHYVNYQSSSVQNSQKIRWTHDSRVALYKELIKSRCIGKMPQDIILHSVINRLGVYSGIGGVKAQIYSCLNGSDNTAILNRKAAKEAGWL